MDKTKIEWTDATWNPIRGCSRVSEGCRNCYAERMAARFSREVVAEDAEGKFMKPLPYHGLAAMTKYGPRWTGQVRFFEDKLGQPVHWYRPRRIFVNSMSDLFHENVDDEWLLKIFGVMAGCFHHTFQVLTKRPHLMLERIKRLGIAMWPNVWLGVSVEDQKTADERIPLLLQTPAAVRWISAEPMLNHINLEKYIGYYDKYETFDGGKASPKLDWVVVGGESGPAARSCDIHWIREIVRQCRMCGVSVFVKQLGAYPFDFNDDGDSWLRAVPPEYRDGSFHYFADKLIKDPKGGNISEWPEDLRVRQFPHFAVHCA